MMDNYDNAEAFRDFIHHEIKKATGTEDISKGLDRYAMLMEWEEEKDRCN